MIDISAKIDPGLQEFFTEIAAVASDSGAAYFMVGATARDMILTLGFGIAARRLTEDIDIGIHVEDWDVFVQGNHLPDYTVEIIDDNVVFHNRGTVKKVRYVKEGELPKIPPHVYEKAKEAAPGYDVYYLETAWREMWTGSGKPEFDKPFLAFLGFL